MNLDVFIAGFGGQGVLLLGNLLACAAIREGKNVSYFPAYGVEKRGGAATCTVVISAEEVGSPVVGRPQAAILLNQLSLDKYFARIRSGGFALVNTSLVDGALPRSGDVEVLAIPMNEVALEVGDARLVNMVAAGAWALKTGALTVASMEQALREVLPERNHRFIPLNVEAMRRGAAFVAER
ncbi:2-oxoglutarate ferredoxin oxidoreductase subunit gamma [Geoalkalibacter ferrihydriticus]|uniref:2-oxoacid:ferredoxin oxidoreductase subunit gamma n=2 Tax=Geoalkalibacter ferrihydriticus TaxID=392333 RepID=A0A0C2HPF1_9BACT|nr:2-oxoacid:acceptor oxidoreductase family protein [Geoalkalibacter ferrihydriticus]KIH76805.1 2-oxoacid:ferredoxin oxidoreductase subunit gamma [Geoalkalibacter ferrihydriticus DSM 17813]SDL50012.1 2-oxoglutarate ferredoxin oxidoreductase subunit gamma [Geoalkalibacter ferrihydriticus]